MRTKIKIAIAAIVVLLVSFSVYQILIAYTMYMNRQKFNQEIITLTNTIYRNYDGRELYSYVVSDMTIAYTYEQYLTMYEHSSGGPLQSIQASSFDNFRSMLSNGARIYYNTNELSMWTIIYQNNKYVFVYFLEGKETNQQVVGG